MFSDNPSMRSGLMLIGAKFKVDDEATQKLMVLFYENYLQGMEKADALRSAKL